jgi:hypothetical protein
MEQTRKTTHEIVEDIISDSKELENYIDTRPEFEEFADVFQEFMNDFIHNQILAGKKISESKKKEILYDRASLIYIWDRHIKTWRDVEIFMAIWMKHTG